MLIFWRIVHETDLEFFKQDPTSQLGNPLNFTGSHGRITLSQTDRLVNYLVGCFFILPFLSSTILNPLLFWYFNKKKSHVNTLFKILAASDFLAALVTPLTYTVIMLDSKIYASSYFVLRQVRPWCCVIGCISQVTTCLIAVTRMLQIVTPFIYIHHPAVLTYFGLYVIYMIVNNGTYYVTLEFYPHLKRLQKFGLNLCIWSNFVHCLVGILASTTTMIFLLYKRSRPGGVKVPLKRNWRICVTIFIMNIPYVVTVVTVLIVKFLLPEQFSFREILFAWLPFCTSGFNPLIILCRMRSVRAVLKVQVLRLMGREVESVDLSWKGKSPIFPRAKYGAPSPSPIIKRELKLQTAM